jgi:TPR repeat protein
MKKYYLMAVQKGNIDAMNNLAYYYYDIEKNYDEMKKYYMMAIDRGHINSMNDLGSYYKIIEKNYDMSKKYLSMLLKSANIKKECDVCYEDEHKDMYYTHCNTHSICLDCSIKLLDKLCPFCRQ